MKSFSIYRNLIIVYITILVSVSINSNAAKLIWDVTDMFNVDTVDAKPGTDAALEAARDYFLSHANDTIVLFYPEGNYDFFGEDHMINFGNGFNPGVNGRLEITGEGYDKTVFITKNRKANSIQGRDVYHVLFTGIHFTRDYCTVTQGTVISVNNGEVVLELHEGFPTPDSLWQYGIGGGWGMYLKRYTDDPDDPHIITENNSQVPWNNEETYLVSGRIWRFALKNTNELPPYEPGDVIGVKLKHGGQTYWLSGGDDIAFDSCKWTRKTRGVLRGGISNIRFSNCLIDRGPKIGGRTPCMASPGGGPQCGQPNDDRIHNVMVENCTVESTGDDNVAFFNVDGGVVRNCHFSDGFARGLLLYHSTYICVENNTFERCAPLYEGGDGQSNCSTPDFEPPSVPQNLEATEVTHNSVTLNWSPSEDNLGLSHYEVFQASNLVGSTTDTLFTVEDLTPSIYYIFRVRSVDSAGNLSAYSENLAITTEEDPSSIILNRSGMGKYSVYPNPAKEKITVKYRGQLQQPLLQLYDIKGKLIAEYIDVKETIINISNLENGLYFFRSKLDNYSSVFIKQ